MFGPTSEFNYVSDGMDWSGVKIPTPKKGFGR
jgi:hypothetical protein